ncbi:hypothetical protein BRD00_07255 [Halobacteriales archaeon QS_8_69_26]|nr:MAG: hypothetical protein BRD00_07255 [Halobacteriales archaeon QS_8_69_26]
MTTLEGMETMTVAEFGWGTATVALVVAAVAVTAVAAAAPVGSTAPHPPATDRPNSAATDHPNPAATDHPNPAASTDPAPSVDRNVDPPDGADAVVRNGSAHFVGQVLFTDAFAVGDDVDLERPGGTFVTDVPLEGDGTLFLETDVLAPGDYVLTDNEGTSLRFTLVHQRYRIVPANATVRNGGDGSEVRLTLESNRDGYAHVVSSPDLDASRIRRVLGTGTIEDVDGDGTAEVTIDGGTTVQEFTADFDGVGVGNYTLVFGVPDTDVSDTLTVEVKPYPPGEVRIGGGEEPLRVQQTTRAFVGGTTTLPEGTRIRITITNDSGQPFQRSAEVRVREDGTFGARFDFSGVPQGQEFTVTVRQDTAVRARATGVVVAPPSLVVTPSRSPDGRTVTVDAAVLPDGGFVAVATEEGRFLGVSAYLDPGAHENVAVELEERLGTGRTDLTVTVHRDTDGTLAFDHPENASVDVPYRRAGIPLQKSTHVRVPRTETATPTPTATATETDGVTPTGTPVPSPTPTDPGAEPGSGDGGGGGGPGFGTGAAVVAVLVLVAVLAARRRR